MTGKGKNKRVIVPEVIVKKFVCIWFEPEYESNVMIGKEEFFSEENGYLTKDIEDIQKLFVKYVYWADDWHLIVRAE